VPRAQTIAKHQPKIPVPVAIERAFANAITERKRVSTWFKAKDNKANSDERHLHFIGILEQAFTAVCAPEERNFTPKTKVPRKTKVPATATLQLQNAFTGLNLEDPGTDDEEETAASQPGPDAEAAKRAVKVVPVIIEKDEAEIETEFIFAVKCFLLDLYKTHYDLAKWWLTYLVFGYDLVVVTIMTNTAIGWYSNDFGC
jgi:hypothetical protein